MRVTPVSRGVWAGNELAAAIVLARSTHFNDSQEGSVFISS
jgi:hypothetical protein